MYDEVYWFLLGALAGAAGIVAAGIFFIKKVWIPETTEEPFLHVDHKPSLPQEMKDFIDAHPRPQSHQNDTLPEEPCIALNFFFDFIFRAVRDSVPVKRWFLKMLSKDFRQLRNESRSANAVIKRVTLRDVSFGSSMPFIRSVKLERSKNATLGEGKELDIRMAISYKGGFHMSLMVDLMLGKTANVSATVLELQGEMRVALRREPHPHYSVSFYEEPFIRVQVDCTVDGRSFAQLNSLIINHIRRSLRKKHTLPAAKMRFEPFFPIPRPAKETTVTINRMPIYVGSLRVKVVGLSDVKCFRENTGRYCILSLENVETKDVAHQHNETNSKTLDIEVPKAGPGGSIGVHFEMSATRCIVDDIAAGSPASATELRVGDVVVAVDGTVVKTPKDAIRLISSGFGKVTISVLREEGNDENAQDTGSDGDSESPVLADFRDSVDTSVRTKIVRGTGQTAWNEEFVFDVDELHASLYVRVYECRLTKQSAKIGKQYLLGFCEINLTNVATISLSQRTAFREQVTLYSSPTKGAPVVGVIELIFMHTSTQESTPADMLTAVRISQPPHASASQIPAPATEANSDNSDMDVKSLGEDPMEDVDLGWDLGQDLFSEQALPLRRKNLDNLLSIVKNQLELEDETRTDLERQLEETNDPVQKSRLIENIEESDGRRRQLALRMLGCISALKEVDAKLAAEEFSKT
eukprot:m.165405 g.165405  ORF g.165405 m.165405 type:complete len:695 (+) comp17157_c0_seq1:174-2258(+)